MTTISEIKTVTPSTIQSNPLTQDDITRMPKSFTPTSNTLEEDSFEIKKESHTLRNTLIGAAIAAAAIVGLKHCSFMKIEGDATTFAEKFIKTPINKLGEWIEYPFAKVYKMIKGDKANAGANSSEGTVV